MTKQDQTGGKVPKQAADVTPLEADSGKAPEAESEDGAERDLNLGAIGSQLRGLYKELLEEPIPDRFVDLLKELENKNPGKK